MRFVVEVSLTSIVYGREYMCEYFPCQGHSTTYHSKRVNVGLLSTHASGSFEELRGLNT